MSAIKIAEALEILRRHFPQVDRQLRDNRDDIIRDYLELLKGIPGEYLVPAARKVISNETMYKPSVLLRHARILFAEHRSWQRMGTLHKQTDDHDGLSHEGCAMYRRWLRILMSRYSSGKKKVQLSPKIQDFEREILAPERWGPKAGTRPEGWFTDWTYHQLMGKAKKSEAFAHVDWERIGEARSGERREPRHTSGTEPRDRGDDSAGPDGSGGGA